jgi:uncharacterized protein (TIGR03437 family)
VFGQDALALSSGTAVAGGAIALNLSLNSPVGSEPAGVQWTLTYPAGNTASIGAVAGSSATAADETITCFSGAGSYTCLLSGMNDAVIQNGVVAVINVTMTSSAGTTPIGLTNLAGATAAGSAISVTGTGGTITLPAPLVLAPTLAGLSCNPTSFSSGGSSTCTAALNQPASAGGATVNLSSSTGALSVPASVTVPSSSTTGTFTATAGTISAAQTAVVTASYNGSSQTASISLTTVAAAAIIPSVHIDMPASGATVSGTATVAGWAIDNASTVGTAVGSVQVLVDGTPVGAATYGVNRPDVCAAYPGRPGCPSVGYSYSLNTATLTPGSHTVTVTATDSASPPDTGSASETITVTAGGAAVTPTVAIEAPAQGALPAFSPSNASIGCNPDPNIVGGLDCAISLAQAAPVSGVTVALQANTSRVQVPVQVVIPAGALSVPFAATVISSDQDTQAQITASVQGALTTASIPITGIRPTSLSCVPQTVQAGGSFTCTVGMNIPNVLQVARLSVSSDSTSFELPSPFTTRPGQAQLSFEVFTTPLAGQQSSAVTVQFGQTSVTSSAAVTPATAPILNLPGTELAAFGQPLAFTFSAVDPGDLPLTLSAANLPAGASFDPATGSFLWTPQAPAGPIHQLGNSSPLERREVTFTATNSARISSTGSVVIEADPGLPVISDLRNAGSQQSQGVFPKAGVPTRPTLSCSPGSVASLLGRWLALGTQPTSNPTGSSTQLAGAEVIVNGNPAPIVYASATRLDFLCPEAAPAGELEISAQTGGAVSNVVDANQQATLGLFSANGSGQGQAMATLAGTSLLATPRSYLNNGQPAEPGDAISILATGAGLDASPALLRISIGGAYTTADQVQPMPGMAGVYRIDVTVPASVASGDAVPVIVQVPDSSGQTLTSNTVTIAVEAR